ncbi:MAG: ribonuclease Z [Bacteroidales bacterium]|nr:ribonuclease Z [Bacteroidales bacterium]MDD3273107.1 ribonuclease Z [Bacteroidales bacterium]
MNFTLTTLGTASALPTVNRYPSAHVLNVHERLFLIDCGEGCQMQLRRYGFSFLKINEIFITHVHGDHIFGLYGLLSTMSLLGRSADLYIYAPDTFSSILESLILHFGAQFKYQVIHKVVSGNLPQKIFDTKSVEVISFPLNHRTSCYGYYFKEKQPLRNVHKFLIEKYNLSLREIAILKGGTDVLRENGEVLLYDELTYTPYIPRSFAYCSDTAPFPQLEEWVRGVDLLYHEATFLVDNKKTAQLTYHSTAKNAATVAKNSGAKRLIIGHFSSRYKDLSLYEKEAKEIFSESYIAKEGIVIEIPVKK